MIPGFGAAKVYIALTAADMRKAINGLSLMVEQELNLDPFAGSFFVFSNRRRDIVKILYWDSNGFCLWQKRLEKDRFKWPASEREVLELNARQLNWLLCGLSIHEKRAHKELKYNSLN